MLELPGSWIWDSWIAVDDATYHLFFLQAPSSLGDPSLRHAQATIGHATSTDLTDWTYHGTALGPRSPAGTTWRPGPVRWSAATTAGGGCSTPPSTPEATTCATSGSGWPSRTISSPGARSVTGRSWRPTPAGTRPLVSKGVRPARPGATRSSSGTPAATAGTCWSPREPPARPGWTTASSATRAAPTWSTWELGPPITLPGYGFGQLEVPQIRVIDGRRDPGLHLPPAGAERRATAYVGRLLHLGGRGRLRARAVGRQPGQAVPGRAAPLRRTAGDRAGRRLGLRRLPQHRARGPPAVPSHRPDPGHLVAAWTGSSRGDVSRTRRRTRPGRR